MFDLITGIIFLAYIFQILLYLYGMKKKFPRISENQLPTISILVAARNEEKNIRKCLESLDKLDYPVEKTDILIIDDNSTDSTNEIVTEFIKDKPKFRIIKPDHKIESLRGKANALAYGLKTVTNEIVMTTDADCIVSETWARTLASYFTPEVAMVCGITDQHKRNLFEGMQATDFIFLLGVASGTINLNIPISCIGNNMAYRKSVYDEVGGYEKIKFSVTEDFQLLHAMFNLKKYKIIFPQDKGAYVISEPCKDIKSLYWQKKRWGVGGLESDFRGFFVISFAFLTGMYSLILPFMFSYFGLALVTIKILFDFMFLRTVYGGLGVKMKLLHFFAFEIYLLVYMVAVPISLLFNRNVMWKGRKF